MKTFISIFFIALFYVNLSGQNCLPAGITITAQSQIDQFPSNNPGCKTVGGTVFISGAGIKNIDSLIQLERISGDLLILNNDSLEHLLGLANLQSVGQAMRIQNNPVLENLDGLEELTTVEGEFFYVGNNSLLRDIQGLERLDSVAGIFQVFGHDSLTSLHGLEQLRWVGNTLAVFNHVSLGALDGLDGLEYVGYDLRIENNAVLQDISALNHPVQIDAALVITGNPLLGDCAVQAVCQYLAAPASFVAISGNNNGCQSVEDVEAACVSATGDLADLVDIRIFPNPTNGHLAFLPEGVQFETIRVRDIAGKTVLTAIKAANVLDLSALGAGFYWVDIIADQWRRTLPVVKK
ncbi:MAG: T9SS type A sorting domain-containing protein [Saprospiraceae bacterium]|nr:T9SS type A sorting domain-containing protein [Saprospiraceae bacterium]